MLKLLPRTSEAGETVEPQGMAFEDVTSQLYDLHADPQQSTPIENSEIEARLKAEISSLMQQSDAPREAYVRFGLNYPGDADA